METILMFLGIIYLCLAIFLMVSIIVLYRVSKKFVKKWTRRAARIKGEKSFWFIDIGFKD